MVKIEKNNLLFNKIGQFAIICSKNYGVNIINIDLIVYEQNVKDFNNESAYKIYCHYTDDNTKTKNYQGINNNNIRNGYIILSNKSYLEYINKERMNKLTSIYNEFTRTSLDKNTSE